MRLLRGPLELAFTSIVYPILEYNAACLEPCRGQNLNTMQSVQNVAAKFVARVIIWDSLNVQREKVQLCSIFKALRGDSVSREINNRLLAAIYSGRNLYGKKVRGREQRTDISKFSFINRTIEIWKSLAPSLLEVCSEHF